VEDSHTEEITPCVEIEIVTNTPDDDDDSVTASVVELAKQTTRSGVPDVADADAELASVEVDSQVSSEYKPSDSDSDHEEKKKHGKPTPRKKATKRRRQMTQSKVRRTASQKKNQKDVTEGKEETEKERKKREEEELKRKVRHRKEVNRLRRTQLTACKVGLGFHLQRACKFGKGDTSEIKRIFMGYVNHACGDHSLCLGPDGENSTALCLDNPRIVTRDQTNSYEFHGGEDQGFPSYE